MTWNAVNQVLGLRLHPGRADARAGPAVPHRRPQRHGQPDAAARWLRGDRPPVRPRRDARRHRGAADHLVLRRPDHARRDGPPAGFRHRATCRRCAPSAPPGRRCRCPRCAPGSTAAITVQQAYGMTESAPGAGRCWTPPTPSARSGRPGSHVFFTDVRVLRPDGTECGRGRGRRDCRPGAERHGRLLERARADRRRDPATAGTTPATPAPSTTRASSTSATATRT